MGHISAPYGCRISIGPPIVRDPISGRRKDHSPGCGTGRLALGLNAIKRAKPKAALLDGYSLEMTAEDVAGLEEARHQIPTRTSISVAFLPGEDLEAGVRAAAAIKRLGLVSVPHISARRLGSADELETFLQRPGPERGIDGAFVIAGAPRAHGAVGRCAGSDPERRPRSSRDPSLSLWRLEHGCAAGRHCLGA